MSEKHADTESALRVARAISDPVRYEILRILAQYDDLETPCSMLREKLPVAPPTLSHHMKELKDAGLVVERRNGRTVGYALDKDTVRIFLAVLCAQLIH